MGADQSREASGARSASRNSVARNANADGPRASDADISHDSGNVEQSQASPLSQSGIRAPQDRTVAARSRDPEKQKKARPKTLKIYRIAASPRLRAQIQASRRPPNSPLRQVQSAADIPPASFDNLTETPARNRLFAIKTQTGRPPNRSSRAAMPRRSRAAMEDEDEVTGGPSSRRRRSNTDIDVSDASNNADNAGTQAYSSHDQMVKKLVRLALAHEVSRKPIRRQDVSDKVLGNTPRAFRKVFDDANKQLQQVFGMAMTELPQKEKVTIQQKRQAQRAGTQSQSSGANAGSGVYIVTSTLSAQYRRPAILPPTKTPSEALEAQYVGVYSLVVSIIMLSNNKRISENKLDAYLSKMNAGDTVAGDRTERIIKRMEREGYITKIKERDGGEETVDFVVGPRGKVEIGERGVAGLVRTIWNTQDHEVKELEDRLEKSLGMDTFKRRTERGGPSANGEDETGASGERPRQSNGQGSRRSTRRSQAANEDEEDEEDDEGGSAGAEENGEEEAEEDEG